MPTFSEKPNYSIQYKYTYKPDYVNVINGAIVLYFPIDSVIPFLVKI